jgi:hypothetical protein
MSFYFVANPIHPSAFRISPYLLEEFGGQRLLKQVECRAQQPYDYQDDSNDEQYMDSAAKRTMGNQAQ